MADLVTLSNYKEYKNILNPENDNRLNILVPAISTFIKGYCGKTFVDYVDSDRTELISIWEEGISQVFVSETPLISITSLWERGNQSEAYTQLNTAGASGAYDFIFDTNLDIIYRTTSTGLKAFPLGAEALKVIYRAGYSTLPEDLEICTYDLIHYWDKEDFNSTKIIGGTTVQRHAPKANELPAYIKRVLDLYRKL